jgi:histidine kinase
VSQRHVPRPLQGTLHFLSPEQTGRIGRSVDYRTDIFSLGVVLYQMLTGQLPLQHTAAMAGDDGDALHHLQPPVHLVYAILTQVPPSPAALRPSTIPRILSDVIMKCLAKNPDDRYQSMFGLSVDLRSCMQLTQSLSTPHAASDTFPTFALGAWDQAAVFAVSTKMYGCSDVMSTLQQSLDAMLRTRRTHVVCIRSLPGGGKTSLITSVFSPLLTNKSLLLVTSKLEEQHRHPFACLKQITNQLLLHFLTFSTKTLHTWKQRILDVFAGNGSLITQLFPVLEQVRQDSTHVMTWQHVADAGSGSHPLSGLCFIFSGFLSLRSFLSAVFFSRLY